MKVRSEIDIVLEIAKKEGWKDCEVFGYGDMITQPQESKGWKLIPADLYKYSIPIQAAGRLHQIINAGVRVQGVIIADDERRKEFEPAPAKPRVSLPSLKPIVAAIGKALLGLIHSVRAIASFFGKALLGLICIAVAVTLVALLAFALINYFWPVMLLGFCIVLGTGKATGTKFDPKLVILVDDGCGGTAWVSLFTWYE